MIIYDETNAKYHLTKTIKPRMASSAGRSWDYRMKRIDGREYAFWFEMVRGTWMYLQMDDGWHKLPMSNWRIGAGINDPFDVKDFWTRIVNR